MRFGQRSGEIWMISHEIWSKISWDLFRNLTKIYCNVSRFELRSGEMWMRSQIWTVISWDLARNPTRCVQNLPRFGLSSGEFWMRSHKTWTEFSWYMDWDLMRFGYKSYQLYERSQEIWMRSHIIWLSSLKIWTDIGEIWNRSYEIWTEFSWHLDWVLMRFGQSSGKIWKRSQKICIEFSWDCAPVGKTQDGMTVQLPPLEAWWPAVGETLGDVAVQLLPPQAMVSLQSSTEQEAIAVQLAATGDSGALQGAIK